MENLILENRIPPVIDQESHLSRFNEKDLYLFKDKLEGEFYFNDDWTIVAEYSELNNNFLSNVIDDNFIISILVQGESNSINDIMKSSGWDINQFGNIHFGLPSFYELYHGKENFFHNGAQIEYKNLILKPFVYYREFNEFLDPIFEIRQDFILLFNLFFDRQNNAYFTLNQIDGSLIKVIKIKKAKDLYKIEVSTKYLNEYLLLHNSNIIRYHDNRRFVRSRLSFNKSKDIKELSIKSKKRNFCITFHQPNHFSRLEGKDLIGKDKSLSINYFNQVEEKKHELFKIKFHGNIIEETCDEEELSSYFSDTGKTHFLTSIYFDKKVLKKYYDEPSRFSVGTKGFTCLNLWNMPFDLINNEYVHVWLGDLSKLPFVEQQHWKLFNLIPPAVKIPDYIIYRDFSSIIIDDENIISKFFKLYSEINKISNEKFQETLFLPLTAEDQLISKQLRFPLSEEELEFETLIRILAIIVNESLNVSLLKKFVNSEKAGSINILTSYLMEKNSISNEFDEKQINKGLYLLQKVRSKGVAHRKSRDYKKILTELGLDNMSNSKRFEKVLLEVILSLEIILNLLSK